MLCIKIFTRLYLIRLHSIDLSNYLNCMKLFSLIFFTYIILKNISWQSGRNLRSSLMTKFSCIVNAPPSILKIRIQLFKLAKPLLYFRYCTNICLWHLSNICIDIYTWIHSMKISSTNQIFIYVDFSENHGKINRYQKIRYSHPYFKLKIIFLI